MLIFDASTLILLAKTDLMEPLLSRSKWKVAIPFEVRAECCAGKKTIDALAITMRIEEGRIAVRNVKDFRLVEKLREDFGLGMGESEAIALAVETRAKLLATDDKCAILACKLLGVSFATAVALLIHAKDQNWIDRATAIERLRLLSVFGRYKSSIIEDARARLERLP